MERLAPPPESSSAPTSAPVQPIQPSYYQQPYGPPPQRPNVFKRALRFLLRRTMYVGVMIGRSLAPFKVGLAIILPLLAIVGLLTTALLWDRIVGPPTPVARVESLPSSPEVEAFLEGQRTYDAEKMWATFSPTFKDQSNMTIDDIKQMTQKQRMNGISYLYPVFIGGVPLKTGGALYFYVVNARTPDMTNTVPVSFEFMVDAGGKILDFKGSLPGIAPSTT